MDVAETTEKNVYLHYIQQYGTLRVSIKSGHNRRFMLFVREKYQDSYE